MRPFHIPLRPIFGQEGNFEFFHPRMKGIHFVEGARTKYLNFSRASTIVHSLAIRIYAQWVKNTTTNLNEYKLCETSFLMDSGAGHPFVPQQPKLDRSQRSRNPLIANCWARSASGGNDEFSKKGKPFIHGESYQVPGLYIYKLANFCSAPN